MHIRKFNFRLLMSTWRFIFLSWSTDDSLFQAFAQVSVHNVAFIPIRVFRFVTFRLASTVVFLFVLKKISNFIQYHIINWTSFSKATLTNTFSFIIHRHFEHCSLRIVFWNQIDHNWVFFIEKVGRYIKNVSLTEDIFKFAW